MRRALIVALLAGGLVATATAGTSSSAVVKTAFNKTLKKTIVIAGNGRTVYTFTGDTSGTSTCAAVAPTCPQIWPYFTTTGKPVAGAGITASLLGTTKTGGKLQVTYNHHPLYYYSGDKKPGSALGQGALQSWYVLSPKGKQIK
jgi:predicted lipoprotein with Yx(FWY)xxD motif